MMNSRPIEMRARNGIFTLVILSAIGWGLILWSVTNMSSPIVALMMPMDDSWALKEAVAVWLMWAVMMGAMMLPSAVPMMLAQRRVANVRDPETPGASRWFLAAYLVAWALFSVAAAVLQWGFQGAGMVSHMLKIQGVWVGGGLLIAAGLFQLTPLKAACLHKCRAPMGFLITEWRSGRLGAFHMGLKHGRYCIGCCWALMMILFVGGVMSLTSIAVLSGIVALEKLAPRGAQLSRLGGGLLIAWGLWMILNINGGHLAGM
jgi:predicted metal-binding membrane protein